MGRTNGPAEPVHALDFTIQPHVCQGDMGAEQPEARGIGAVVHALESALWAFWTIDTFEAGALAAVNLGNDADTTGAIYGQMAGAHYGLARIPVRWRSAIALQDRMLGLSDSLWSLASFAPG